MFQFLINLLSPYIFNSKNLIATVDQIIAYIGKNYISLEDHYKSITPYTDRITDLNTRLDSYREASARDRDRMVDTLRLVIRRDPDLTAAIRDIVEGKSNNSTIKAIKALRYVTNCTLLEAKNTVLAEVERLREYRKENLPDSMDKIEKIEPSLYCTVVKFSNGVQVCSHTLDNPDNDLKAAPNLRE